MARFWLGGGPSDMVFSTVSGALRARGGVMTFWSAQSGGVQHTDLLLGGVAVSSVRVGSEGQIPAFQGPDGVGEMWAQLDADTSRRYRITPRGGEGPAGSPGPANSLAIGTVTTVAPDQPAAATVTGSSPSQTLSLAIPKGDRGEPGLPGVNAVPADEAVATYAATPGSATNAAFAGQVALPMEGVAASTARLLGTLDRADVDATILVIGDSTGNASDEWVYLSMARLAARHPAWSVDITTWDDASGAYPAMTRLQVGTGSRVLRVYNCSVSGKAPGYVLGARWLPAVVNIGPVDLAFVSHGHNMGDPISPSPERNATRVNYLALTEELKAAQPQAGLVLVAQNPTTYPGRTTWQAVKAGVLQRVAAQRGYGFIDVHQAFIDYATRNGVTVDSLLADQVHPTSAAQLNIWTALVDRALTRGPATSLASPTEPASSLLEASRGVLPNPLLTEWSGVLPDGWTAINCTVAKETTDYETGTWAARITAGTTGASLIEFNATPAALGLKGDLNGRTITVRARIKRPAGYTGTPSIVVKDQTGSSTQFRNDMSSETADRYSWVIATKRLAANVTNLTVQVAPRLSGSQAGDILLDRIDVVVGDLPRESTLATRGATGASGTAAGQLDYCSTFGDHPLAAIIGTTGGAGVQAANQANLHRIKAPRDILLARLDWYVHTTGGNYDIGIYDAAGNRLWSKGSTAIGSGAVVETVSPAVPLARDATYWVAWTSDATTGLARGIASAFPNLGLLLDGAPSVAAVNSAFPLPASLSIPTAQGGRMQFINLRE